MRRLSTHAVLAVAAVSSLLSTGAAGGDGKTTAKPAATTVQALMREKLEAAHGVLEGTVLEDYAKVELHAGKLQNISVATTWHRRDDETFLYYAKSFQNAAQNLVDQAKAKNLAGVGLGQVRLNLSCIECHNYVRAGRPR
jgi:hypothetical protein